jgi:lipoprotein-releasing system permease protein
MLSLKIAWRFLQKSRVQSALIIAGIAVGIAVQIFVGSLITSLQDSLVKQTIGSTSQVTITALSEGDPFKVDERVLKVVRNDARVKPGAVAPTLSVNGLYSSGNESTPLALKGGDLASLDAIANISGRLTAGTARLNRGDILVGKDFADKYALSPGTKIQLTFPGNKERTLTISGIFDLGSAQVNARQAFVSAEVPRALLGWRSDEFAALETQLVAPFDSATVAAAWRTQLKDLRIVEWQEQNKDLLTALQSQGSSSYMIQAFVLIAVALGIASTLAISAVQKTRQIGILKAMGMNDAAAGRIFLWQATILGVGGTLSGLALGFFLLFGFSFAGASFSITPKPGFVAFSAGVGIVVALLSSIIPIRKTSALDPIEVIQGG